MTGLSAADRVYGDGSLSATTTTTTTTTKQSVKTEEE